MALTKPPTRYAKSDGLSIAYQVFGDGPIDLVFIPGFVSNVEAAWLIPSIAALYERLASFARVIVFDKRGTGVSDPIPGVATLEERMDDLRAVMDAAGSERAALFGFSEGGPMAILFAATYPERVESLALYGSMARTTEAPDYPYAPPAEAFAESTALIFEYWGQGINVEIFTPSVQDEPGARQAWAVFETFGATPDQIAKVYQMFLEVDVRDILPAVAVPVLVTHRRGDRVVSVHGARWMAEQIPGARFVEFPGTDHSWLAGNDTTPILDEIEEFFTGSRPIAEPDRVLATVTFTDIVSSTERAAKVGDHDWHSLLDRHHAAIRKALAEHRGEEVKTTGDGFLATFDGPARAIRCGQAIVEDVRAIGIEVRVGIHSGEVEKMGADVAGIAVHIASRVGSLALPGDVLVSETVKGLVAGSGIAFDERGEHELKGIPDRWRLFTARA
jgi:pimeloyl-ACP methyl ester carboxylesterase